jgi:glucose dehydrogenase
MHADRNGFFYVLNRDTGKLVAADPFVTVNWATHVDLATGKPVEAANNEKRPQLGKWARDVCPNLIGGKNWSPMSYSKQTGFVYLPAFNMCMDIANREEEYTPGKFYLASEFDLGKAGATGSNLGEFIAWDPVAQKKAWSIEEENMWASGAMSTAGGLVFYGNINGIFKAVDATTGKVLWQFRVGTGITQSAVTYSIDGKQYIAVVAGRLKGPPSFFGKIGQKMMDQSPEGGILMVFSL